MKGDPKRFQKFDADNGWETYKQFIPWIESYLKTCEENPDAKVQFGDKGELTYMNWIWLINKLNKLSSYLLFKMANVMEVEIWMLLLKNDIMCDVEYVQNNNDSIKFNIITEDRLSYEQGQKVYELIGKYNDEQYDRIRIDVQLWDEKDYKDIYGER